MNLWHLIPFPLIEGILNIEGILMLPYVAIAFYGYVLLALVKYPKQRVALSIFILLSVIAMLGQIRLDFFGSGFRNFFHPLLLLIVMVFPLCILIIQVIKQSYDKAKIWSLVTLAGWTFSISWATWFLAMAAS